ncbi:UNVERIFIED_CONTAM: hypothetical protein Slati_4333700 [Sesamum latifolium]|uniref:Uncharacterized protein n=1 Tax=Sesamum latifolium TaxID=2727402 RepID=A0AAW2SNL5_9LAMI
MKVASLYEDFICQGCAVVCSFLTYYPQTISSPDPSSSSKEKAVLETDPPVVSSGKLENKSDSTLSNANSVAVPAEAKPMVEVKECSEVAGPSTKCIIGIDLFGNPPTIDKSKPIFLSKNWREVLCRCGNCSNFYAQKGIGFLLDKEDSIAEYERVAKQKRNENLQKQEGVELNFLNNLGHVAKMEILSGIADMKNEFCAFLESTDPSKPITTADVQQVFDNLAKKRKRTLSSKCNVYGELLVHRLLAFGFDLATLIFCAFSAYVLTNFHFKLTSAGAKFELTHILICPKQSHVRISKL